MNPLTEACPTCAAQPGIYCQIKDDDGLVVEGFHASRWEAARFVASLTDRAVDVADRLLAARRERFPR